MDEWQIVHQEAYKRWKKYACRIGDIYKEIQAIEEQEQNKEIEWQEVNYAVEELNNYPPRIIEEEIHKIQESESTVAKGESIIKEGEQEREERSMGEGLKLFI
ncbi:hypothetical protein C1646_764352 [Rhizophagus diaphanus]|nr:hypothetical protein C1646_764352 [Rhizophagus diaphanus] [Rhizophagus sp. MUCL 43196]